MIKKLICSLSFAMGLGPLPLGLTIRDALAQPTLEIIALRHRSADQVIPVLRPLLVASTVGARFGEWIELGGSAENIARSERGIVSTASTGSGDDRRVWVKIEELQR